MNASPAFSIVELPDAIVAVDDDASGSWIVVRRPIRSEIDAIAQAAAADDLLGGLSVFYSLAAIAPETAAALPQPARDALDAAIVAMLAPAVLGGGATSAVDHR